MNFSTLPLTKHEGGSFRLKDFSNGYLFLTFFYTRCPMEKMCPLSIRLTNQVVKLAKTSKVPLRVVGITLDPKIDTQKTLADYAKRESVDAKTFWLATGTPKDIDAITSEFNVIGFGGAAKVSHNIRSVLLGPGLKFIKNFDDNDWKPEDVVNTIRENNDLRSEKTR